MTIAVDFDGTIVEHRYPEIGKEIPFAFVTLRKLLEEHHKLILWTVREGELLDEAVDFCRRHGVDFFAVNSNYPDEPFPTDTACACRKVRADLFIDDCALGGLPDWGAIYQMVHNHWTYEQYFQHLQSLPEPARRPLWKRLLTKNG